MFTDKQLYKIQDWNLIECNYLQGLSRTSAPIRSKKSDRVNRVAPASPIQCLFY